MQKPSISGKASLKELKRRAALLDYLCKQKGFTIPDFAEKSKVAENTIRNILNASSNTRADILAKVAKALEIDVSVFYPDSCISDVETPRRSFNSTFEGMERSVNRNLAYRIDPAINDLEEVKVDFLTHTDLSEQAIRLGIACKPPCFNEIYGVLKSGKNIFIEGDPGHGKSALAAWIQVNLDEQNIANDFFRGEDLGNNPDAFALQALISNLADATIVILDNAHLILPHCSIILRSRHAQRLQFLFFARTGALEKLLDREVSLGSYSHYILEQDYEIHISKNIARVFLPPAKANELLTFSGADLVFTKWMLASIILNKEELPASPIQLACKEMKRIKDQHGVEALQIFLALAALRWAEFPCPQEGLTTIFKFSTAALDSIIDTRLEVEKDQRYIVLKRHPKLARLFVDASQKLDRYFEWLLQPLCERLNITWNSVAELKQFDFASIMLATFALNDLISFYHIEAHLAFMKYKERTLKEGMRLSLDVARAAIEIEAGRLLVPNIKDLAIIEKRLFLTYLAVRAKRLIDGGEETRELNTIVRKKLLVGKCPSGIFASKGYVLYQQAYLEQLNNNFTKASALFRLSAKADEKWASAHEADVFHWVKANQSRNVAMKAELLYFEMQSINLDGNIPDVDIMRKFRRTNERVLSAYPDLEGQQKSTEDVFLLYDYWDDALMDKARLCGWLNDEDGLYDALKKVHNHPKMVTLYSRWAQAILAYVREEYEKVIENLEAVPAETFEERSGEVVGVQSQLLAVAYYRLGDITGFERWCYWILSDQCPKDAGNGPSKEWAKRALKIV